MNSQNKSLYHGRGSEGLRDIAENGVIRGFEVEEHEVFPSMSPEMNVYGKEDAVWVTDEVECAKVYGWGGGYLEIDPSELKVVDDRNSSYAVIMRSEVSLDHIDRILVEQQEGDRSEPQRDLGLEIANLLDEEHQDIRIGSYQPTEYSIKDC